ncbi:hypothetical protein [Aquibacillus rhizosphaerae]|uniref:Uncharacterized protein n=1 Tax=Aquibacillus rhizosphaerae TaxID=3051431 RepID=A0ABT7LB53_9BACI|nr:hypothetical protein [Aquibacillus sp. LR5S19]MDL4842644.1 hypothetical protein [Aquibacillus sp. LR5S19]
MKKHTDIDEMTASFVNDLQTPNMNRHNVVGFLLIGLDIMGLIPIISEPFSSAYFWPAVIPIVIINLWAILYIVAPFKYEKSYYLFFGVFGVVNTYIYFLVIQKFLYIHIGVDGSLFFIVGLVLFISLLLFLQLFNLKMLYSKSDMKKDKNGSKINVSLITVASSGGYIIAQIIMPIFVTDSLKIIILIIALSLLSILTAYFSIFLQKYFYIGKNYKTVKTVYPEFGLPKKLRRN